MSNAFPEKPDTLEVPVTLLGFDYSERRIGVAVGQSLTGTAQPLEVVRSYAKGPDWGRIAALVSEWQPDAFVVGVPLNMDGSEQSTTKRAQRFGRSLRGRFNRPVHFADERLSTREARTRMELGHRGSRVHRDDDDHIAAQVILEGWLAQARPSADG
jgi:putative Holliday junction resolvase